MNYYAKAIDIVAKVNKSSELKDALILEILKQSPGAICKAARVAEDYDEKEFLKGLKEVAKVNKIQAIKDYRTYSGAT